MTNQNREIKSETTGANSAIKKVVKERTVNGTKYCNKPSSFGNVIHQTYIKANVRKMTLTTTPEHVSSRLYHDNNSDNT